MTIARIAAQDTSGAGSGGSLAVNYPAATTRDNQLFAFMTSLNPVGSNTPPAGWTTVLEQGFGAGSANSVSIFTKRSTGEQNLTFTSGTGALQGIALEYTGTAGVLDTSIGGANGNGHSFSVGTNPSPRDSGELVFIVFGLSSTSGGGSSFTGVNFTVNNLLADVQNRLLVGECIVPVNAGVGAPADVSAVVAWTTSRLSGNMIVGFRRTRGGLFLPFFR